MMSSQLVGESDLSMTMSCNVYKNLYKTNTEAIFVPGRGKPKNRDALIQETLT